MLIDPDDICLTLDAHRDLVLPFDANARSADGIPFDARGQSRIAAVPRMHGRAPLPPACSACFFRRRTGLRVPPHTTRDGMLFNQCDFVNAISASQKGAGISFGSLG